MEFSNRDVLKATARRLRPIAIGIVSVLMLTIIAVAQNQPAEAVVYNKFRGPNYTSRIILTFDDCPKTLTAYRNVLVYTKANNIGLVLAPTGNCITSFRRRYGVDIATLGRQHGQYLINHSVSHPDLRTLSHAAIVRQLKAPGVVTNFGRPPYGATNTTVNNAYASVRMNQWLWTKDTNDWRSKTQAQVVSYVVANSRPRDTVLMHLQWNGFNPSAIGGMKSGLAKKGFILCRAYRGADNAGAILTSPQFLPTTLPC